MTLIRPYSASFYVGDNVTKTFSFVFDEVAEEFVKVMVSHADGTVSIPTYTVDMDLKQVIFGDDTPAPSDDDIVCVYRATPVIQDTPFRTLQGYNAQALENILSKIVAMIQEVKATYFSTQILQGAAWQLDLLKSEDDGATVNIDYVAKKLVKGLYFRINNGNLQVSADGSSYITMPKSSDIVEFRQVQTVLPDLTVQYRLQYRIGNEWFNAESNAEATADEALRIAEEARDTADDAKDIAQDASDKVDGFDDRITQAEQDSSDAKNTVDAHVLDTNNPHSVTASQVGLGNVNNTADIDKPISTATQGALDDLQDEIDALKGLGRFLSVWNCATGLAETNPPESPYTYNTGDYFLVGTVGSTNYRPDGATYTTGVASTTVETAEVKVNDVYIYDGTNWKLQANSQRQYTFSGIAGSPYDNTNLGNALNGKVDETSTPDQVYGTDNNGDPTTYTVTDFGKVDDVKVNNVSVVTSKVANIDLTSYIENTATGTDSLTILGTAATTTNAINIGKSAVASGNKAVSMGDYASAEGEGSIAIGSDSSTTYRARATHKGNIAIGHDAYAINDTGIIAIGETAHAQGKNTIQLGTGTNNTQNTFQVRSYTLLDTSTGLIPDARISTNIARSSDILVTDVTVGGTSVVSAGVAIVPAIPTVNNPTITIKQGGATKGSFTLNQASGDTIDLDAGGSGGYHPDLFSVKWSDHQINDIQWLRGDTFSWQDGSVYEAAYQHLVDDISGKSLQTETVAGTTISFYLADDGHKICPDTQASNVSAIFTATGVAWYYILDTVNQRFKLPRTQYGFTGLRDTVEKYVAESLPNIRGYNLDGAYVNGAGGSFVARTVARATGTHSGGGSSTTDFDASVSSSAYQDDAPVQERATQMYLYFYVGSFTQTAIENTAGLNASLFNGKADVDLSNTALATADYVVEKQDPTALNNYTWYRKYKSGWVEQGGIVSNVSSSTGTTVTLPIEMANNMYVASGTVNETSDVSSCKLSIALKTATQFKINIETTRTVGWEVKGFAA